MKKFGIRLKHFFDPIDLTKGNILRVLLTFSIPVFISVFLVQLYGILESFLYGHSLLDIEIMGISNANASLYFVTNLVSGLSVGLSVISGNAIGANDIEKTRKSFVVQLLLTLVSTLIFTLIFLPTIDPLLEFTGVSKEANSIIYEQSRNYIFAIYLGMIFESLFYFLLNYIRSIGETSFSLVYVIGMIIISTSFNLLFVMVCQLGVYGVAISKYLGEFLVFCGGLLFLYIKRKDLRIKKEDFKFSFKFIAQHIKVSLPYGIQFAVIGIGLIFIQKTINSYGDNAIVAYNYSTKYVDVMMSMFSALGTTILAFASQNYGAKDYVRVKKGFWYSCVIALIIGALWVVLGVTTSIDGKYLNLFLSQSSYDALNVGNFIYYTSTYSIIAFSFSPILGLVFITRNFLIGIKRPLFPFLSGLGETGERISASYLYGKIADPINPLSNSGFFGFAFGQPLSWCMSVIIMLPPILYLFFSKKLEKEIKKASNDAMQNTHQ